MRNAVRDSAIFTMIMIMLCWRPASAEVPDEVWATLSGERVTIEMVDGATHKGKLLVVSGDEVSIVVEGGRVVTLAKREVDGVIRHSFPEMVLEGLRGPSQADRSEENGADTQLSDLDGSPPSGIAPGEFRESAYLIPTGTVVLHGLSGSSTFRVHSKADVHSNLVRWASGPNAAVRLNLVETHSMAVALEPSYWKSWNGDSHSMGVRLRYTAILPEMRLHLSIGGFDEQLKARLDGQEEMVTWAYLPRMFMLASLEGRYDEDIGGVSMYGTRWPISIDMDWMSNQKVFLRTGISSSVGDLFSDTGYQAVGRAIYVASIGDNARIGVGVILLAGEYIPEFEDYELNQEARDLADRLDLPELPVSPLPWLEFWWAI